jgi:hypothetical protein
MNTRIQLGFGIALLATALGAFAQTWDYKYYKQGPGGAYERDRFFSGSVELNEKDGKATMRLVANMGARNNCLRGEVPALVTKTDATTTIEPQLMQGCDEFRYVIRNDGSGGEREVKRNDKWITDGFDHGLTRAK